MKELDRPYVDHSDPATEPARAPGRHNRNGVQDTLAAGTVIFAPEAVLEATAPKFGLTVADLKGPRRTREISEARDAAYWLIRRHTRMCLERMADCMGRVDHSGVVHALRRAEKRRVADPWFGDVLQQLERELEEKAKGAAA